MMRACLRVGILPLFSALNEAAQIHSNAQAAHRTMSHQLPGQASPAQRLTAAGYDWTTMAENVAYGYADVATCMREWMESPGHRANILKSNVVHFGCAVAYSSDNVPYYTQEFASDGKTYNFPVCPSGESTPIPAPAPVPAPKKVPAPAPAPKTVPAPAPVVKIAVKPKVVKVVPAPKPKPVVKTVIKVPAYPKQWTCIQRYTNGKCRRWKRCYISGRKIICQYRTIYY
jgi:hypothetical protein